MKNYPPDRVLDRLSNHWAGVVLFMFCEPIKKDLAGKVLLHLERAGVSRAINARLYAPLLSATGHTPAGWLKVGDFLYLDGDDRTSWQIVKIDIDWEGLFDDQ